MRALELRDGFRLSQPRLAPRGSPAWTAVTKVLRALGDDAILPGPEDVTVHLPHAVPARPVPGTKLVVAYVPGGDVVLVIALMPRG